MSALERIIDRGNRRVEGERDNWITCADGFRLSVLAGPGAYCTPRPRLHDIPFFGDVPESYPGPFACVEVGFPSELPEPWDGDGGWLEYAENDEDPTGSVYGYVPVDMVRALVAAHGGDQ